jgi:hypothetical protein
MENKVCLPKKPEDNCCVDYRIGNDGKPWCCAIQHPLSEMVRCPFEDMMFL